MAEALGVATGIIGLLPVAVQVVNGFRIIRSTIAQLRACTRELKTIEVDLEIQERRFLNECQLIIHMVAREKQLDQAARAMMENPSHPLWNDQQLNERLRTCFSRSYDVCMRVIEGMVESLQDLQHGLASFDVIHRARKERESLKTTFRRLRESFIIVFDKAWYEKKLDRLRKGNQDLESLRSHIASFQSQSQETKTLASAQQTQLKSLPHSVAKIHEVSLEAHRAVTSAFTCEDPAHTEHAATLSIHVEVENPTTGQTSLDMAITYNSSAQVSNEETSIRFLLQSRSILSGESLKTLSCTSIGSEGSPVTSPGLPTYRMVCEPKIQAPTPRRRARFEDSVEDDTTVWPDTQETTHDMTQGFAELLDLDKIEADLGCIDNTCAYLKAAFGSHKQPPTSSLVYLSSSQVSQYMFYLEEKKHRGLGDDKYYNPSISLQELLRGQQQLFSLDYQVKIALKTALTVLQFHSTPWLDENWMTSDLLLGRPALLEVPEPQLFLRSILPSACTKQSSAPVASAATGLEPSQRHGGHSFSFADYYGINNMTLFGLGVALLEIAHWKPLASMRSDYDADDVLTARRLARQRTLLGGRYQDVIQKCLQCNFGYGTDLANTELQNAVYNSVVCPLEDILAKLKDLDIA